MKTSEHPGTCTGLKCWESPARRSHTVIFWGLVVALGQPIGGHAQDIIVRTNNARVEAQVLEVLGTQITYKPWARRDGPTTVLGTDYVKSIEYQNGTRRDFTAPPAASLPQAIANQGRNLVGIRPEDLIFGNLTVTYERLTPESRLGLKVPLSIGLGHSQASQGYGFAYYQYNKIVSTGLELNLYMTPAERVRYFVGPALQWGRFRYRSYEYVPTAPGAPYPVVERVRERVAQRLAVVVNGGMWYQMGQHLVFSADAGFGLKTALRETRDNGNSGDNYYRGTWHVSANLNLGYQF